MAEESATCSSLGCLIVSDDCGHHGVTWKLDYGIRPTYRPAVIGEEGIEEGAQHTGLGNTSVHNDGQGGVPERDVDIKLSDQTC